MLRPGMPRSIVASAIGLGAVGAMFAPAAHGACSTAIAAGPDSVVECRAVGHQQAFVVPAGVSQLRVFAVGAAGGDGGAGDARGTGGYGAVASGTVHVAPDAAVYVLVGGIGRTRRNEAGLGGFNGGGRGGASPASPSGSSGGAGGGGGGASDLRTCSTADTRCDTLASRLIVAGGGGGGGGGGLLYPFFASGGSGGNAGPGTAGGAGDGAGHGSGATPTAGGAGGPGGTPGGLGIGGDGAAGAAGAAAGGGGGGGVFGGGGAANDSAPGGAVGRSAAGGGAGSSFGPGATQFATATSPQAVLRITYVTPRASNPPPAVRITQPRTGASVSRLVVRGRATDASGVKGVALRIERLPRAAQRCTWLDPKVGLRRARCDEPVSLTATLGARGSWSYRVRRTLPPGSYRVAAYGTDETGIYGNSARAPAGSVRFRVGS